MGFHEFSITDLRSGQDIVAAQCRVADLPDWLSIHGLLSNAIYGGPIDNDMDARLLLTFLQHFFCNDMFGVKVDPVDTRKVVGEQEAAGRRSRHVLKGISVPQSKSHADYVNVIKQL